MQRACILAAMLLPPPALSQETPESGAESQQIERISITGSHLRRRGADAPIPTTVLGADYIDKKGITSIGDMMIELPAINAGINGQNNNLNMGNAGLNLLNLRALGYTRTLVLVNGRRHVGSQAGNTAVDVSTLSPALIERVETITGGASAVYGADAVSGVVNFITKQQMDGLQLDGQIGAAEHGAAEDMSVSITAGSGFNQDKGQLLLHLNYAKNNGHLASDRDFSKTNLTFQDTDNDGVFEAYNDNVIRVQGPTGVTIGPVPGGLVAWTRDGNFTDPSGNPIFGFASQQGGIGLRTADYAQPRPATQRVIFNGRMDYALSPSMYSFFDAKYALTRAEIHGQPAYFASFGNFARPADIYIDNPYLHPDVVAYMQSQGLASLRVEKASEELGLIDFDNRRHVLQLVTCLEGDIGDDWNWSVAYQYGRSEGDEDGLDRDEARAQQAIDVIRDEQGVIRCRDQSNGCAPMNLFGRQTLSEDVIGFMMFRDTDKNTLTQKVFSARISGEAFTLPAGRLGLAAGLEYRQEHSEFSPSQAHQLGSTYRTNSGALLASRGEYDVKEAYIETLVPLLQDKPWANQLSLEAALRRSDYSLAGTSSAWKLGLSWEPVQDLKLRFNRSKSVRAANIAEMFQPQQPGFAFVEDPCHFENLTLGASPANRQANCLALGLSTDFQSEAETSVRTVLTSGSRDLTPETALTTTLGLVYTPSWLNNLTLSVDNWEINIADAIQAFSANNILNNCVDLSSVDNEFCRLVSRDAEGQISNISVKQINIANFNAAGLDLEAHYQWQWGDGQMALNVLATYLRNKDYYETPQAQVPLRQAGNLENPQWQGMAMLSYQTGAWNLSLHSRYVGSSQVDAAEQNPSYHRQIPSYLLHSMQLGYQFQSDLQLYLGINNLLDEEPPRRAEVYSGQGVAGSFYDTVGRFAYLGARYQF
ncbi:TonB-dependent receptor [Bowmanella denitrificans]|uniref:TonB-dependent receptor n=2 Tax=Bowmanella denitrificans TaxID=366582 RepID=A0ABP3GBR4_9ALTE